MSDAVPHAAEASERRYHEAMSRAAAALGMGTVQITVTVPHNPKWLFDFPCGVGVRLTTDELNGEVRYALATAIGWIDEQAKS